MKGNNGPGLSHWEKDSWVGKTDLLVIGSGIVGLNAALSYKLQFPAAEVTVLERGILPSGASTKNAGFACFGSLTELIDDLERVGWDDTLALVKSRWKGLLRLQERVSNPKMRLEPAGGFELFRPEDEADFTRCQAIMDKMNAALAPLMGPEPVYRVADARIDEFGFTGVQHLVENTREGLLDPGRMMRELLRQAQAAGVLVLTGIAVTELFPHAEGVTVHTQRGWCFPAEQVIVATNGFAQQLLPELAVKPARAQVLITSPIPRLPFRGGFHYDRGYFYFRNLGDRVLFGGGRNLDFAGEETAEIALTERIQSALERLLREVILPGRKFRIAHRWAGIMGVGENRTTILRKVHPRVTCAVRLGGMGVAIGTLVGEAAARIALRETV
ncbi:MAG: FAD-dependent oxidoreductase [Bacteroidota bacterium]